MSYRLLYSQAKDDFVFHNRELFDTSNEGFLPFIACNEFRNKTYKPEIEKLSVDRIVIDLGCGSGFYGINALNAGAKFVYFIDISQSTIDILTIALQKLNIDPNRYALINSDIESLTVEHFRYGAPEIVYSEFFGPQQFDEGWYPYTKHLDSLFPNLHYFPEELWIHVVTWDADFTKSPWPHTNPELIESFKVFYANKLWRSNGHLPEYIGQVVLPRDNFTSHGFIFYNANTKELVDELVFTIDRPSQMIGIQNGHIGDITRGNNNPSSDPDYGWWIDEPGTYKVKIDIQNACEMIPRLLKV